MSTWRERFAPLIRDTLAKAAAEGTDLKKALRDAYPCQRMGWAYKCWLDECARQRGTRTGRIRRATPPVVKAEAAEQNGQRTLFG